MKLSYPLWLYQQTVNSIPGEPVWSVISAQDSAGQNLRYARFLQHWKEAPIIYTDPAQRIEYAQIVPRLRQTRIFDILDANGNLKGSVSLDRGKTLQCTFHDSAAREIAIVQRALELRRSAQLPVVYTLTYNGAVVWRLEYRLVEKALRIESVQPLDEDSADLILSGLCAVVAYQRV